MDIKKYFNKQPKPEINNQFTNDDCNFFLNNKFY